MFKVEDIFRINNLQVGEVKTQKFLGTEKEVKIDKLTLVLIDDDYFGSYIDVFINTTDL